MKSNFDMLFCSKTTLCVVYKDGEYPQDPYVPTIFENYAGQKDERDVECYLSRFFVATVMLNDRKYVLNLFDSAGQVI